ncbi:hypothetical protein BC829DRAFT_303699 [Chytridium lagenaria]|nr:hypothetical protein BC829DRAFT_303699 [Chytridium lagenaria]
MCNVGKMYNDNLDESELRILDASRNAVESYNDERQLALEDLLRIEEDLRDFRERLYKESISELERCCLEIYGDKNESVSSSLDAIKKKQDSHLVSFGAKLNYIREYFEREFELAVQMANLEFLNKRKMLRRVFLERLYNQNNRLSNEICPPLETGGNRRYVRKLDFTDSRSTRSQDYVFPASFVNGLSWPKFSEEIGIL